MVRRQEREDLHERKLGLDSVSPTGASGDSVFTIGFRYDFSFRVSHK